MNMRNAESAVIAGSAGNAEIADNAWKVRRIEPIPEGSNQGSPALQCWVRIVPTPPSRRDDRNVQMWALSAFREIENHPSSLPGRTAVKNADPALKCWATFIRSLRDSLNPPNFPIAVGVPGLAIDHGVTGAVGVPTVTGVILTGVIL
jgi:hypothetical protein